MDTFKVGDHFERIKHHPSYDSCPKGYRGVVKGINFDTGGIYDQDDIIHEPQNIKKIDPPINSPVRTISKREIVPGDYNNFQILYVLNRSVGLKTKGDYACFSSKRLREAAQMFIEMAEVLEENSKDKD